MKKQNIIIATVGLGLLMGTSCKKDFLQQNDPNAVTVENNFQSPNDILLAVNGIYQSLRSSNNIGESSGLWTDERSDDTGRNDNQSNAGEPFQFNNYSLIPSNTYLKSHWVSLYSTISRANFVLTYIDKVQFSDQNQKAQYTAEAKFLRALMYFHLVRLWGDVPLVTKALTSGDDVTANTFREKQATVYAQIVADLTDAANAPLPNLQTSSTLGRISKAAVNTLLGQVYLTMATTQDQSKRTDNLNNAKTYLLAAYNLRSFGALSSIPYTDVFDVTKKATCPELIWQIDNKQGDINYSSTIAADNQAKGETINSLKPASGVGGNVQHDLINEYESSDPRMAFSVKFANDAIVKDWFITKYRDTSPTASNLGYGGNDWILMRYADVILMLAEVSNYLGNTADAIQYLDMVRTRAGMPTYAVSMTNPTYSSKFPTLKLAILHERRVELAFEHHRWFDLLRTFTTDELVSYFKAKNPADFGAVQLSNFSTKDRYYPIPFDEYKLNPVKMYQNPGY
ncbi:RagB/SusD family nutrient uptake outer membrane protein [Mucilaginibacter sp. KACC 22063]|uniref:RagB/SusD family nutrient uptake outer membrane protein n=1 Tax=Mucilaginibacter sp. KACC 22063 TaxID=3025666 RepID=UPI0023660A3A|nr:RagB/SusD family nutrient uptake outer membrane protein [Mucilaginibacter sp. KACC 22063]WDF56456.1 RagB/SusD family nutrient uptake outer membrane protein [Mucilaginibacter sp. KACC 22063]